MYAFASIAIICLTILWVFHHSKKEIKIIHEYHNYEYLDERRFPDPPPEEAEDDGRIKDEDHQDTLDLALKKIQESINKVNGIQGGLDE
jgi:hypothetical protein